MLKLTKFQVTDFRSVADSGPIETDDVTALIGTNEAGKTNILLPLWKFSPAKDGEIVPTADYPRKLYNEFRVMNPKPDFITAEFQLSTDLAAKVGAAASVPVESVTRVSITRDYDGNYGVDFPDAVPVVAIPKARVSQVLASAVKDIEAMTPLKSEEELKTLLLSSLNPVQPGGDFDGPALQSLLTLLDGVKTENAPKTSVIVQRHKQAAEAIRNLHAEITRPQPRDVEAATELVLDNLPQFVYYSTYGNLDSEIYLPQVIENLGRKDLGIRESAKARTLKVLFEFVKLKPQEILELGQDFKDPKEPNRKPTDEEIAVIALKKKERSILLQSASTLLTAKFREWWKQGEYRFRFEADGNHFRIWVSDDKRPEEIELEGRSTGLQWFLSFYLVFLVERTDAHDSAILLLDEPGLSLHPLAQRDLSEFFDGLAKDNQLLYTCHSPFLVDADRLDRARKVYVSADGTSKVTDDLRAGDADGTQKGAAYAVHAAVGLSVAESMLIGCEPIVVEGPSDQHYLTAIKTLLIAAGRLKPGRELVFPPAGGTKGVKPLVAVLGGKDAQLPVALLDSDAAGRIAAKNLKDGLYAGDQQLVLELEPFINFPDCEVEDLIPPNVIATQLDRWQRTAETGFGDVMKAGPVVPQIEAWAANEKIELKKPGWKVELAKRVKQQLLRDGVTKIDAAVLDRWAKLFDAFQIAREDASEEVATT